MKKTQLLVINNSGWGDRTAINAAVSRAFNYTVWNTYSGKTRDEALAYAATEVHVMSRGSGGGGGSGGDGGGTGGGRGAGSRPLHHKHRTPKGKRIYSGGSRAATATAGASGDGSAKSSKEHRQRKRKQSHGKSQGGEGEGEGGEGSGRDGDARGRLDTLQGQGPGFRAFGGALSVGTIDAEASRSSSYTPLINRRALQDSPASETSKVSGISRMLNHKLETAQSRFALCPSGLGFDTYRLWETLLLGTIPIVESNLGFDRTYSRLPVLVVRNFSVVTPRLLYDAYPCFIKHANDWDFSVLTMQYWLGLLDHTISTGDASRVHARHPMRNKHCDFLDYGPEAADAGVI